jgi:FkbM family methyltransferase
MKTVHATTEFALESLPATVENSVDALELKISDGVTLAVSANLQSITTYVLLEQECWFEKEIEFLRHWLRPGMTVIDVGANVGVYSLLMARLVGPTGQVFSYEPGSEARALLERSRELNGAENLRIFPLALSNRAREGRLLFKRSIEDNALDYGDGSSDGETILITTLDQEIFARRWPSPDFIKIDAEGEEPRILEGGRKFFDLYSPLIMFETQPGERTSKPMAAAFAAIGYRLYRLLVGAPILVPVAADDAQDPYELNLFAAKPDRAKLLQEQDVLVDAVPEWEPDEKAIGSAMTLLNMQAFAAAFRSDVLLDPDYVRALAAYAVWRTGNLPAITRSVALGVSYNALNALCQCAPTNARLATYARIAWEMGSRQQCLAALQSLSDNLKRVPFQPSEPFWPPCARYDTIAPGADVERWFIAALTEQFERARTHSTLFEKNLSLINWLCSQPSAPTEMERRRILIAAHAGEQPAIPPRLCQPAPDHLNADIWRTGKVPGTIVGS